jgi:predicted ATPase
MFELGARPHAPRALYRAYLEQSDVFIGIYWQRYGWIAPGEEISGLEDEYRLAGDRPKLIYVKTPAPEREPALQTLLDRIRSDDHASYKSFSSTRELRSLLENDLAILLTERFFQAAPSQSGPTLVNVPASATSFLGRDDDVHRLSELLRRRDVRLVTLTGPGGVGKTRLSMEVTHDLGQSFPGGILFVSLASVTDPSLVLETVAQQVGAPRHDGWPALQRLQQHLEGQGQHVLLVLDNLEQVTGAAPDIAALLGACPQLTLLVTSRTTLQIRGETEFLVAPLEASAGSSPAVRLFLERARAINPTFASTSADLDIVAAICQKLDGLPLAIELAAARARILSPQAILDRLDNALKLLTHGPSDLPDRQKTLRGTLDWSFQLLDQSDQQLFAQLSVFAGGWTLEAAEAVCGEDMDVLDRLMGLVERSLVRRVDDTRFSMLSTIREYAAEHLAAIPDGGRVAAAHARYFLNVADEATIRLRGPEQPAWRARLSAEQGNVRAALRWMLDRGELDMASRLQVSLMTFWWIQGYAAEARRWADELLPRVADEHTGAAARAHLCSGLAAAWEGDYTLAVPRLERAIALFRELRDPSGAGVAQMALAYVLPGADDSDAMLLESAADLYQAGDLWAVNIALQSRADVALANGNVQRAQELYEDGLQLARSHADGRGTIQALIGLGFVKLATGDATGAAEELRCSLQLSQELANAELLAYALRGLAGVAHAHNQSRRAAELLGAAQALGDAAGTVDWPARRGLYARFEQTARDKLGARQFGQAWAAGRALSVEQAVEFGLAAHNPTTSSSSTTSRTPGTRAATASALSASSMSATWPRRCTTPRRTATTTLRSVVAESSDSSRRMASANASSPGKLSRAERSTGASSIESISKPPSTRA